MSLYWQAIFALMIVEAVVCLLIALPLVPNTIKLFFLNTIRKIFEYRPMKIAAVTIFLCVLVLFVDSQREAYQFGNQLKQQQGADAKMGPNVHTRLLGAQRNGYLSGFTLFLFLILYRFSVMVSQLVDQERDLATLRNNSDKELESLKIELNKQLTENARLIDQLTIKSKEAKKTD